MTIELSYQKGQKLTKWMLMSAIRKQLPELLEYKEEYIGELENIPVQMPYVKDSFDIKVTITINHESLNNL